jgi:uroporphyrinogen-III synthase
MPMAGTMAEAGLAPRSLAGLRVLVTRPRHQSDGLVSLIEGHGGVAVRFPVIEVVPVEDPGSLQAVREAFASLGDDDMTIFVSPNAVEHGLALAGDAAGIRGTVAAVGARTAAALEAAGRARVVCPTEGASSEALLALPELAAAAVAGSRILIVRGEGGRPVLGDTLSKRGARVAYAEVYRRERPGSDPAGVAELGAGGGIDAIVVTSVEGFENLFSALGQASSAWLRDAGYVVASQRVGEHGRELGVAEMPLVAAGADDEALLEALLRWRGKHPDTGS